MNEEQLRQIEENIAEVISGNILLASDGPRIAAMVMERLEVKDLLGDKPITRTTPDSFTTNGERWSFEELYECTIRKDFASFTFVHPTSGRNTSVSNVWLDSNIGYALVDMDRLIRKKGLY